MEYKEYIERVNWISELKDNFDGEDSFAPSKECIKRVLSFIGAIQKNRPHLFEFLDSEDIYPTNWGTVVLEFENKSKKYFSLEIGKTKADFFVGYN